jgi:phosphoglycolate phosphatase-like HAD superfamily hydrolase
MIEGAELVLKSMKKAGLFLGIATNGSGKAAFESMRAFGLDGLFDVFIGARGKTISRDDTLSM